MCSADHCADPTLPSALSHCAVTSYLRCKTGNELYPRKAAVLEVQLPKLSVPRIGPQNVMGIMRL